MKWRYIPGYKGLYMASNTGIIKSVSNSKSKKEKILKQHLSRSENAYLKVVLSRNGHTKNYLVHRIVAILFVRNKNPSEFIEVNHLDRNKLNNNYKNLEWTTHNKNLAHSSGVKNRAEAFMKIISMKNLEKS